jgi:hypothetical protein
MSTTARFGDDWQRAQKGAFEKDTLYRLIVESTRYWVIEHYLRRGCLPDETTFFAYANEPNGFDWGNPAGPDDDGQLRPLRGKRVRITLAIEDH